MLHTKFQINRHSRVLEKKIFLRLIFHMSMVAILIVAYTKCAYTFFFINLKVAYEIQLKLVIKFQRRRRSH